MNISRLLITAALLGCCNDALYAESEIDELDVMRQELHATFTGIDAEIYALKGRVQQLEDTVAAYKAADASRAENECQPSKHPTRDHPSKRGEALVADSSS